MRWYLLIVLLFVDVVSESHTCECDEESYCFHGECIPTRSLNFSSISAMYFCVPLKTNKCLVTKVDEKLVKNDTVISLYETPPNEIHWYNHLNRHEWIRNPSPGQYLNISSWEGRGSYGLELISGEDYHLFSDPWLNDGRLDGFRVSFHNNTSEMVFYDPQSSRMLISVSCEGYLPLEIFRDSTSDSLCSELAREAFAVRDSMWVRKPDVQWTMPVHIFHAVCGMLSFIGSSFIIFAVLYRWRSSKEWNTRDRILLGMSSFDLFSSLAIAFGPLPTPRDAMDIAGALGTHNTCTAQGVGIQLGLSVPIYNAVLSIFFLLAVGLELGEETITYRIEWLMHLLPIVFAVISVSFGLARDLYHSNGLFCYVEAYPFDCRWNEWIECDEQSYYTANYQWYFGGIPIIVGFTGVLIAMTLMSVSVARRLSRLRTRYGLGNDFSEQITAVTTQALLYVGAFFFTYIWIVLASVFRQYGIFYGYWLTLLSSIFWPLQGFVNAIIFLRPTYIRVCQRQPGLSRIASAVEALKRESVNYVSPKSRRLSAALRRRSTRRTGSNRGSNLATNSNDALCETPLSSQSQPSIDTDEISDDATP